MVYETRKAAAAACIYEANAAKHYSKVAIEYARRGECRKVAALDSQRACGKSVFGGGLLLSERAAAERAAAERAAAERAAAHRWPLSDRERELVRGMGETA